MSARTTCQGDPTESGSERKEGKGHGEKVKAQSQGRHEGWKEGAFGQSLRRPPCHLYQEARVVDLGGELGGGRQKTYKVIRNLYPTVVDRWLSEGGPGFEEPQRRAIDHVRALWHRIGGIGTLVANLNWIGGGHAGRERGLEQAEALAQLAQYASRVPRPYWTVFENVVRNDMAAGAAGSHMANNSAQAQAHAKNCVGFVASLIAMWRGF